MFASSVTTVATRVPRRTRSPLLGALAAGAVAIAVLAGCTSAPSSPLPSGFPTSEVPVATGDAQASTAAPDRWKYSVKVKDSAAQQAALQKLRDAGYIVLAKQGDVYTLSGPRFNITLTTSTTKDGKPQVEYQVTPRPGAPTVAPTPAPTSTKK